MRVFIAVCALLTIVAAKKPTNMQREPNRMAKIAGVTYKGPPTSDTALLAKVPADLRALLVEANGFVAFDGGLHVRGICDDPAWHSLAQVWTGPNALHKKYSAVNTDDIPFGEDALGDQYLLRNGKVLKLLAESGGLEDFHVTLDEFIERSTAGPVEYLALAPLKRFQREGKSLTPGRTLLAHPPFVTKESGKGVSLKDVPTLEALDVHADLARQISGVPDGGRVRTTE